MLLTMRPISIDIEWYDLYHPPPYEVIGPTSSLIGEPDACRG